MAAAAAAGDAAGTRRCKRAESCNAKEPSLAARHVHTTVRTMGSMLGWILVPSHGRRCSLQADQSMQPFGMTCPGAYLKFTQQATVRRWPRPPQPLHPSFRPQLCRPSGCPRPGAALAPPSPARTRLRPIETLAALTFTRQSGRRAFPTESAPHEETGSAFCRRRARTKGTGAAQTPVAGGCKPTCNVCPCEVIISRGGASKGNRDSSTNMHAT